jgi:hypothetical protein
VISDLEFQLFSFVMGIIDLAHHRKKFTQALESPKTRYFVVFFYWDASIGYKSRTYSKGYGTK